MALTESQMIGLGQHLPEFSLLNVVSNKYLTKSDVKDRPVLIMFICNHCPYVKHVWHEFSRLEKDYQDKGLVILAVNANDIENYPQDGPENMQQLHRDMQWSFPFLLDEEQSFAKALHAACTPDFYVFDAKHALQYRGQLDDSRPGNPTKVSGQDIRKALDRILQGKPVDWEQKPSIGCNIKWKKGNEPEYF
ncbi:thioredoxin family protein [bacterium]|nr:thioredoxin family protein [bacterium]